MFKKNLRITLVAFFFFLNLTSNLLAGQKMIYLPETGHYVHANQIENYPGAYQAYLKSIYPCGTPPGGIKKIYLGGRGWLLVNIKNTTHKNQLVFVTLTIVTKDSCWQEPVIKKYIPSEALYTLLFPQPRGKIKKVIARGFIANSGCKQKIAEYTYRHRPRDCKK